MRVRRAPGRVASLGRVDGSTPLSRRLRGPLAALVLALAAPGGALASPESGLRESLTSLMEAAPSPSGAFVRDADDGKRLFAWKHTRARILASNTKLFTIGAALARYGPDGRLATRAMAAHPLRASGVVEGNLYLVGGGDPTFGSRAFVREHYGGGGTVEQLANRLHDGGLREVRGRVVGDESLYDSKRSGPSEGYEVSTELGGPMSALAYNHGLTSDGRFQADPAKYAAARLTAALRNEGVDVAKPARDGRAPDGAAALAETSSLPMSGIARLTGVPSENFFAEMLAKGVGDGTTAGGASAIVGFARTRAVTELSLADGSGLARSDRSPPQQIVFYLDRQRAAPEFGAFFGALPTAGVDGTLADRMTSGYAHRNCHAKTGTLRDVSALSGYCATRGGHTLVFSILMNGVSSIADAQRLQDRMAEKIAKYTG